DWPEFNEKLIDNKLEKEMSSAMELASVIHALRKQAGVKVRIPLKKLSYKGSIELPKDIEKIVLDEVNVYSISYEGKNEQDNYSVIGDTTEKNQDIKAGEARDIIRKIQGERKLLGTKLNEKVNAVLESWPVEFEEEIKKKALINNLEKGKEFKVTKIQS
ncbi:hypothetical protein C4559_00045, partial [Candidatus Microgenomates bacterium]